MEVLAMLKLNPAQRASVLAAIEADPVLSALPISTASAMTISKAFDELVAPEERAWSSAADARTIDEAANYTGFDALAAGKRDAWAIHLQYAPRDYRKSKNRNLVVDVWGNATAGSVSEAILTAVTRPITRAEKLLGGGASSTVGTVAAKRLSFEGSIDFDEIELIRGA
jgi:hypothetical protein